MRIGAFEVDEPIPELNEPHVIGMLRPWVDAGNVGTLVLSRLEAHFGATNLARLARPGNFFDFTRYRPTVYWKEGRRQVVVPNSFVTYARQEKGNDFLFFHLLEPHMLGETYIDSIWQLLRKFKVKRYCMLGSMYDVVPHTRPLIVSGGAVGKKAEDNLKSVGVGPSDYQGPTSIIYSVALKAADEGIETVNFLVHLPQYTQLEDDFMGVVRLMQILNHLYGIPIPEEDACKAEEQQQHLSELVANNPQVKEIVTQVEAHYDARIAHTKDEDAGAFRLSPEVERFLREMDQRFREDK